MPNVYEPLVLEIEPPYIGSAFSPTVDIDETADDITVTITDSRGEHSYTVEKTDQAIADAEAAAANANQAASDVLSAVDAASTAATRANQSADAADDAASDARAATVDTQAATLAANAAASYANEKGGAASNAANAANSAASSATSAASAANSAASTASTAATNADAKAQLADTAAANADTATQAANTATTNATNAAQAANNAADVAIEAAEDMPRLIGTVETAQAVADAWPTTIEGATVYGECVQDGTPTPENPVEVQVVEGVNLLQFQSASQYTINDDGTLTLNSMGGFNVKFNALPEGRYYLYARIVSGSASGTNLFTIAGITYYASDLGTSKQFINAIEPSTIWVSGNANFTVGTVIELMLTTSACTAFAPYGSIALQIDESITPIDLQGNVLASLPDGTRDVLRVDSAGRVWIDSFTTYCVLTGADIEGINSNANAFTGTILYESSNYGSGYCSICTTKLGTTGVRCKIGASNKRIYFQNAIPNLGVNLAEVKAYFDANPATVV